VSYKVFISAALRNVHNARIAASHLWTAGHDVVSTWHDTVSSNSQEPDLRAERAVILSDNFRDLELAQVVFVLTDNGPRCALVEAGYALARGKRVMFVGETRNVADAHDNASWHATVQEAVEALEDEQIDVKSSPIEGRKFDNGKIDWTILPFDGLEPVVRVLEFGAKKYDRDNWRYVKPSIRYFRAALRHMVEYVLGRRVDPDSGESPLAHAACSLLFFLALGDDSEPTHPPLESPASDA